MSFCHVGTYFAYARSSTTYIHQSMLASGSYDLKLSEAWEGLNNYIQLIGDDEDFKTILFEIRTANGTARFWTESSSLTLK